MITTTRILFLIAIALILGLAVTVHLLREENAKLSYIKRLTHKISRLNPSILKKYNDSAGVTHTIFVAGKAYTPEEIGKGAVSKPLLDTIRKALDIKSGQVIHYMKAGEEATLKKLNAIKEVDSLERIIHRFKNDNIEISYQEANLADTINKDGIFGYKYYGGVNILQYKQRKKFAGISYYTGKTLIDISPIDKNTIMKSLPTVSVVSSEPTFGVRAVVGGFYNLKSKTSYVGAGAEMDLKKVTISGGYYLSPTDRISTPIIGLKYNFKIF